MYTHQTVKLKITDRLSQLRKDKHDAGFPFMVTDPATLPQNQAYMEYADGTVEIVQFSDSFHDYRPIRVLSKVEASDFRRHYQLQD